MAFDGKMAIMMAKNNPCAGQCFGHYRAQGRGYETQLCEELESYFLGSFCLGFVEHIRIDISCC